MAKVPVEISEVPDLDHPSFLVGWQTQDLGKLSSTVIHFITEKLGGRKIAANHYPHIARHLAESGHYDAVFYGHDHTAHQEQIGETLLLNPGEVMGRFGKSTFAWYDTETGQAEIVEVS